jgi:hypothetical protein
MLTMTTNWWTYYGPQPLQVFGFPLYWGAMNSAGAVGTGVLLYRGRQHFAGSRAWLAVFVPPLAFGFDFAVGWPTWNVMNTSASTLVISLVSLVTIALCAAEVWFVSSGLPGARQPAAADPARSSGRAALPAEPAGRVRSGAGV